MAALTQHKTDNKEIGDLLLQVQDELKSLRTLIARDGSKVDIKLLQTNIQKAEEDIKQKSDFILNQLNSQVKVLPMIEDTDPMPTSNYGAPIESLWDLTKRDKKAESSFGGHNRSSRPTSSTNQIATIQSFSKENNHDHFIDEIHEIKPKSNPYNLSPGQHAKVTRETRLLFNPENVLNRNALNENYNVQLPLIENKKSKIKVSTHLITGSTVEHLATLPLVYRRNPTLIPPPINPNIDSKHGILSLIERGLIPPTAKITFDQFPITTTRNICMNQNGEIISIENETDKSRALVPKFKTTELVYKLDPNYDPVKVNKENRNPNSLDKSTSGKKRPGSLQKLKPVNNANTTVAVLSSENFAATDNPLRPPATPLNPLQLELYDSSKFVHKFVIQNGRVKTDLADFSSFKQSYILRWGSIVTIIKYLEDLCRVYSVPFGVLDGSRVSELSRCVDMDIKPSLAELLDTFLNKDEVEKLIKSPGQLFKRKDGRNLAATKIQSAWKRYKDRSAYLQYRKRKWAAGVIALTWLTYVKISKAREKLKIVRIKQLESFKKRQKEFIRNWPKIKESRRIIIHIPSLGYSETIRNKMRDLPIKENYQMARICDIIDSNVDVIYVSPIQINEETLQYYSKLFGLRAAVESGNPKDLPDISIRYKIVIPEALNSFPTHQMALSTILKYSPKAIERIQNLIKGREAYIVPGVMNSDDLHIADILNVPIMGSEPEVATLYTTKSGSKRIFQSAKVFTPFGEFDIYNKEQLYECLAQAITENLIVQRWILKLDDEFDGRGIAYCDVSKHLSCYNWALKEMIKFGDKWGKRWAYEPTFVKILEEIPEVLNQYAKPANTDAYPTFDSFLRAFLARGGILEAHPPSDSVTSLTVSLLIEPDLSVKILSSGDHIHANSMYSCWGVTFPQTSVEPKLLNETCMRIANACKQRNIMGYIDVDFVTFIDPKTDNQVLWATDLSISYSDNMAISSLMFYLSNGKFDSDAHYYEVVPLEKTEIKPKRSRKSIDTNARYAVMSTKLNHSNLSVIHYSVFFQTCRALGIGYDIKERQGTIFTLVDSLNHTNMGMITLTDNLQTSMQQFAHNLTALHREISSESMQGRTNFLAAAQDIQNVLASNSSTNNESNE